ncbi:hypothetical protein [Angustibacter luteus]|uniref:Uncharacterized protein n=1 Tax=Angustibacter luteus TaxID=658456 RepID=A0ABW1JIC4_9ACTN
MPFGDASTYRQQAAARGILTTAQTEATCAPLVYWAAPRPLDVSTALAVDSPVSVRVNHGRWLVDCPCGGAQLASRTDQRFLCCDCGNALVDGLFRPVVWPPDADAIETALAELELDAQNWPVDEVEAPS